jgi:hypothetical protein
MNSRLTKKQARMLAGNATQTRFTWAVIFLAFIAGLVGLLPLATPYESTWFTNNFLLFLMLTYVSLAFGLSYSFYAIWKTTYLILLLITCEDPKVKRFLQTHWTVFYSVFFVRNDKVVFRKSLATACSFGIAIPWVILFFLRYILLQ